MHIIDSEIQMNSQKQLLAQVKNLSFENATLKSTISDFRKRMHKFERFDQDKEYFSEIEQKFKSENNVLKLENIELKNKLKLQRQLREITSEVDNQNRSNLMSTQQTTKTTESNNCN